MDKEHELETYLRRQIPLSAAMEIAVEAIGEHGVTLSAPLAPNINHKRTVFGGSAASLGILAAWSLVHLKCADAGLPSEVVIQGSEMDYDLPITGRFTATSALVDPSTWPLFEKTLRRRGRARIAVSAHLAFEGAEVGRFSGRFVAFTK